MASETRRVRLIGDVTVGGAKSLERTAKAAGRVGQSMDKAQHHTRSYDRATKGAAKASSNTTKNFSKNAQITEGLVPAYARLAAQVFAVSAAFQFLKDAGDLAALREGQLAYANATGIAMRSLTNDIKAAAGAQISFRDAAQAAAIGTAAGLNATQLKELGTAAKNTSLILGRDVTDSFNRLVRGVTKAEPELLDELGIILRLRDATEKYKQELGITGELTSFQRSQAVTRDVLGQVEEKYTKIIEITNPAANSFNKFAKSFDKVLDRFKEFVVLLGAPIADFFSNNIMALVGVLGVLGIKLLKEVIPGLDEWAASTEKASAKAVQAHKEMKKQFSEDLRIFKGVTDPRVLTREIDTTAKAISQKLKNNFKKGAPTEFLGAFFDPEQLKKASNKSLGLLKGQLKQRRGIYANYSQAQVADLTTFINELQVLQTKHEKRHVQSANRVRRTWELAYAGMRTTATGFYSLMTKATVNFAKGINKALRIISIVGILSIVADFIKSAIEGAKSLLGLNKGLTDSQKAAQRAEESIASLNSELKDFNAIQSALNANQSFLGLKNYGNLLNQIGEENLPTFVKNATSAFDAMRRQATGGGFLEGLQKFRSALTGETTEDFALESFFSSLTDAQKESFQFFKLLQEGIDTTGVAGTEAGQALRAALHEMEFGGGIFDTQKLENALTFVRETAAELANIVELNKENASLRSNIANSAFQLSDAEKMLKNLRAESAAYSTTLALTSEATKEQVALRAKREKEIAAALKFITPFVERQLQATERKAAIEQKYQEALRGTTPLLKDEATTTRDIEQLRLQAFQIETDIRQTRAAAEEDLTDEVKRRLQVRQSEADELRRQAGFLEQQRHIGEQLKTTFRASFESGFQQALGNLVKNKEGSLTESIKSLAVSVLESLADTLVKDLTAKMSKAFLGQKSPAQSIWEALVDGGRVLYENITSALSGKPVRTGRSTVHSGSTPTPTSSHGSTETAGTGGFFSGLFNMFKGFFGKIFQLITSIIPGVGGASGIAGTISSVVGSFFANGGVAQGGFRAFATGGVVDRPTLGMVGEGRYNEAVVPLPDGKSIPVMGGGGNTENNVEVNVNMDNQGNATSTTNFDSQQAGKLGGLISNAVKEELQRQKRPGGILSPYGAA